MDDPPGSRLFIVCGKAVETQTLQKAFEPFGCIQNVKYIRDKGVAYVKYDKASCAALAMEALHGAVLNNGRGPKLKVLLADAPNSRLSQHPKPHPTHPHLAAAPLHHHQLEHELSTDPDNLPPRSRLFIVVPKTADGDLIQEELSKYPDLDYCKTDLISTKGVVFCKYTKSSSALTALEEICKSSMLAGYKVKCMLAEPKTKRNRPDAAQPDIFGASQASQQYGMGSLSLDPSLQLKLPVGHGLSSLAGYNALTGVNQLGSLGGLDGLSSQVNLGGFLGGLNTMGGGVAQASSAPTLSRQRLFVVVHKGVTDELLQRLFRRYPGMEYCDLKKDRTTGKSKGYAYINYSTPEAAAAAIDQLNGIEFPPHSGHRIKVMYAEPLGVRPGTRSPAVQMPTPAPASPVHAPLSPSSGQYGAVSPDMAAVQEGLASMGLHQNGDGTLHDVNGRIASPVPSGEWVASPVPSVARELMFNIG